MKMKAFSILLYLCCLLLIVKATPTELLRRANDVQCSPSCKECYLPSYNTHKSSATKRVLSDPSDNGESVEAYLTNLYLSTDWLELESERKEGDPTAAYWELRDKPETIGVGVLHGCVTTMVFSHKGVYISHHWEVPSFGAEDKPWVISSNAQFKKYVLDEIELGGGNDMPSLNMFTGAEGPFAPKYKPKALVLRRQKSDHPAYDIGYEARAQQLADLVTRLVGVTANVVTYKNMVPDSQVKTAGKAVFQYDPNEMPFFGDQTAISKLWIESDLHSKELWDALDSQKVEH